MFVTTDIVRNKEVLEYLFKDIIKNDGFICGGFARYSCSTRDRPIVSEDIDIYCPSDESFTNIKNRMGSNGYSLQFESEVAETYRFCAKGKLPLQLIKPKVSGRIVAKGSIEEIMESFDFTIARFGIFSIINGVLEAIADDDSIEDEQHLKLVIKNIHCPIAQVYRVSKYLQKGYHIATLEVLKILQDWEDRDESYKTNIAQKLMETNLSQFEIQELEKMLHWD